MKFSEGKHPIDCLTNLFLKYCREYQKVTINIYEYIKWCKYMITSQKVASDDNLIIDSYIWEAEVDYKSDTTKIEMDCDFIWLNEEEIECSNEEVSLFLNERQVNKAFITFLNPCLIFN